MTKTNLAYQPNLEEVRAVVLQSEQGVNYQFVHDTIRDLRVGFERIEGLSDMTYINKVTAIVKSVHTTIRSGDGRVQWRVSHSELVKTISYLDHVITVTIESSVDAADAQPHHYLHSIATAIGWSIAANTIPGIVTIYG